MLFYDCIIIFNEIIGIFYFWQRTTFYKNKVMYSTTSVVKIKIQLHQEWKYRPLILHLGG